MVCVPCFIIPALIFLWHRFVQPYVLRWWNPWAVKDEAGNVTAPEDTPFPITCAGGVCKFSGRASQQQTKTADPVAAGDEETKSKSE